MWITLFGIASPAIAFQAAPSRSYPPATTFSAGTLSSSIFSDRERHEELVDSVSCIPRPALSDGARATLRFGRGEILIRRRSEPSSTPLRVRLNHTFHARNQLTAAWLLRQAVRTMRTNVTRRRTSRGSSRRGALPLAVSIRLAWEKSTMYSKSRARSRDCSRERGRPISERGHTVFHFQNPNPQL